MIQPALKQSELFFLNKWRLDFWSKDESPGYLYDFVWGEFSKSEIRKVLWVHSDHIDDKVGRDNKRQKKKKKVWIVGLIHWKESCSSLIWVQ